MWCVYKNKAFIIPLILIDTLHRISQIHLIESTSTIFEFNSSATINISYYLYLH